MSSLPLSYLEISAENLIHNFQTFRKLLKPKSQLVGVIKGNAYGHGQNEIAQLLEDYLDFFQVDDLNELRLLRKVSQKPTLLLGFINRSELEEAVELNASLALYDLSTLPTLARISKKTGSIVKVHLPLDSLLGREGFLPSQLPFIVSELKKYPELKIEGVYSHFANIEDTSDFSHAQKQIEMYEQGVAFLRTAGLPPFLTHISATAGSLVYQSSSNASDLVRLGIGLYGLWPSEDLKDRYQTEQFQLKPVLRWITHIAQVKELPAQHPIGYGLTFITTKPTRTALIPQGYSDGYDRRFSNNGTVLIQGKHCPILGRVAMNMFVVDVSHLATLQPEEEVVLLGNQGTARITAEELAQKLDTINYEITTRISPLLPRLIT